MFKRLTPYILLFGLLSVCFFSQINMCTAEDPFDYESVLQQLQTTHFPKVPEHIEKLSELGSRFTGYNSSNAASEYIYNAFANEGLSDVQHEYYNVTVPIDRGASIEIVNPAPSPLGIVNAYPLKPNLVNPGSTPRDGIVGQLIYIGQGKLEDFNGKDVADSIVVIDFNSKDNWIKAAMLGAKAILFTASLDTSRFEAETKTTETPLEIPRLYISRNDSNLLLSIMEESEVFVRVRSRMDFEVATASNVVGFIQGSQYPDEVIVISSYYDSASIVPSLSPGADEACGIATLLELASFFSINPPKRTLMFVAFSGHNQQAAGAREFVYQHRHEINSRIKILLNIDLSATGDSLVVNFNGWLYKFNFVEFNAGLYGAHSWIADLLTENVLSQLEDEADKNYDIELGLIKDWVEKAPIPYVLDHEPFTAAGGPSFSFLTGDTFRLRWNTPLDSYVNVDIDNLINQVEYVFASAYTIANLNADEFQPISLGTSRFSLSYKNFVGYSTLTGRVVEYNPYMGWFEPVANAIVHVRPYEAGKLGVIEDVLMSTMTTTNDKGEFEIHGVASFQPDYPLSYFIEAFRVNSTGHIVYAPNFGSDAAPYTRVFTVNRDPVYSTAVVFKCGGISFYGLNHPHNLAPVGENIAFTVRDIETHTILSSYGYKGSGNAVMVFAPPDRYVEIVGTIAGVGEPALIATNSSEEYPEGYGYMVEKGEIITLGYAYASIIRDIISLTRTRQDLYEAYNIKSPDVTAAIEEAQKIFSKAQEYYNERKYDRWIAEIKSAYVFYLDAFHGAKRVLIDVSSSVIFFSLLLIPFVAVLERLLFEYKGLRRVITMIVLYIFFMAIFNLIHPGIRLASNLVIVIIGISALILSFPPLLMIYNEGLSFLKEIRRKLVGVHFAEIGRLSAVFLAFSTGIMSMKKRKARTILTLLSIVLVIYSLILFTSTSFYTIVRAREWSGQTLYEGILIRSKDWSMPLSEDMFETLRSQYGKNATIGLRAWMYPPASVTAGYLKLQTLNSSTDVISLLGLTPEEAHITKANSTLISGGRWFSQEDLYTCVLADKLADQLGVNGPGDFVSWGHIPFEVVGIFNSTKFASIRDLDQEQITPRELIAPDPSIHIKPEYTFIIPYRTARLLGASIYNISLRLDKAGQIANMSSALAKTYAQDLDIYGGINGKIRFYRKGGGVVLGGLSFIVIPATIGILIIINTAVDTVHGRKREIGTFTVVGLAPIHIAGMFLAEFFVYAMVGAVIGYLSGMATTSALVSFNLLPAELNVNASSSLVLYVVSFAIASMLIAVAYPLREAARISVPSIERAWKMPTKPRGDEWRVPLPFVASTPEEAEGTLAYLREYFEIFSSESAGGAFAAEKVKLEETEQEGMRVKTLSGTLHLAPFDLGIIQSSIISAMAVKPDRHEFQVYILRQEGPLYAWRASNRNFVDALRKQLLLWRGLPLEQKAEYAKRYRILTRKRER